MKHNIICNNCQLKNEPIIQPQFIDKNKEYTVAIFIDLLNDNQIKYNTIFFGKDGKLLKQIIDSIKNYNILLIPAILCKPNNDIKNILKIVNICVDYIATFINNYKIYRYLILGRNALNTFERLLKIKTNNLNLDQLDRLGLQKIKITEIFNNNNRIKQLPIKYYNYNDEIYYRITYGINVYTKTKLLDIYNSIIKAFEDIFEEEINIIPEENKQILLELENTLSQFNKEIVNIEIDANNYDLIYHTKDDNYFYYLFYNQDTNTKKIIKFEPFVLIYNDSIIKQLNYLDIINIKHNLKFTNDLLYQKQIKKLSDLGLNFSLYILDGTNLINHLAFISSKIKNNVFNTYKPTYIDIETIDDKIVLATIIHNDKIYLFTDKYIDKPDNVEEIYIINDNNELANAINNFLKENAVIVAGWNVYFDIYYILKNIKHLDFNNLKVEYQDRRYCNYPYYAIYDIMYLYEKFINPNSLKYSLDYVAYNELGKRKILTSETFEELYKNNFQKFVEYNILDTILVKEIDEKHDISLLTQQIRIAINSTLDADIVTRHSKIGNLILIRELLKANKIMSYNISKDSYGVNLSGGFVQEPIKGVIRI